jgi:hypothetical protein
MKQHAPATIRNREAIAAVLAEEMPERGTVLEIAAGTGEHAAYFASRFPALEWLPTDPSDEALASIAAYRADYPGTNLIEPAALDASLSSWPAERADAIVCINMVHISPWEASVGLFAGGAQVLATGAPLILYGPYFEDDVEPAPSNLEFDRSLKNRDPHWGIRQVREIDKLAERSGFTRTARHEMPANNLTLVYRRK